MATAATTGSRAATATTSSAAAPATTSSPTPAATTSCRASDGNDVIHGGNGLNLILGGFGNDFIITGEDAAEAFGGPGNDFILGAIGQRTRYWQRRRRLDRGRHRRRRAGDNFDPFARDPIIGNDVFIGGGASDRMNGEGGDDIMVGNQRRPGDRYLGGPASTGPIFKDDPFGVTIDFTSRASMKRRCRGRCRGPCPVRRVEGLSGSALRRHPAAATMPTRRRSPSLAPGQRAHQLRPHQRPAGFRRARRDLVRRGQHHPRRRWQRHHRRPRRRRSHRRRRLAERAHQRA